MNINPLHAATRKADSFFGAFSPFLQKHFIAVIVIALAATAAAAFNAMNMRLESDFDAMLPENYQSVKDLRRYQKEVASTSTLSIGVMTKNIDAAEKFADDLAVILGRDMKDKIHYVEYNIKDVRDFFRENALLYMDREEMEEKYNSLRDYIGKRKLEATGLLVDIDEEPEGKKDDEPPVDLEALIEEYNAKAADYYGTREDGYYVNKAEDLLAMTVYPRPGHSGVRSARALIDQIKEKVKSLHPEKYAADMKVGFAGPVQVSLDEYEAIKKDIVGTLGICIALVVLVLLLYYLRIRPIILIAATLGIGITITMGISRSVIGYLNAQTAFLGSIIIGTGINYSIILLARYMEERKGGHDPGASLTTAMVTTWRATLSAALTTAVAFGTLGLSKNLSFKQFGFIASTGIMIIWIVTLTVLPAMVILSEKAVPMVKAGRKAFEIPFIPSKLARSIVFNPWAVIAAGGCLALLSAIFIARWLPRSLEYDFRNLRNKVSSSEGVEKLDSRIVNECTRESTSPIVAVTGSLEEADRYCRAIEEKNSADPGGPATGECKTLMKFLPRGQEEKISVLRKMDELLSSNLKLMPRKFRKEYEEHGRMLRVGTVTTSDLPETIKRKFRNVQGKEGVLAAVYPVPGEILWIYENLDRFVDAARAVNIGNGKIVSASGAPIIFYDLVQTVAHDAPRDTLYAIAGVFLIIFLILGRARDSVALVITLMVAVASMAAIAAISGIKINFFNFVAIPTAFGTGADYGINILMRYISERGRRDVRGILTDSMVRTGGAVFLCSATTILGYLSLMTSNNLALVSYGKLAIAGEVGCLLTAVLLLPALILKFRI